MARNPDKKRCKATNRKGKPCGNWAKLGYDVCHYHGAGGGAPKKNKNAEKHGLFSKYLPRETMDLVNGMESLNTIDMLWDNIKIQYAAIIRSQGIMYVENKYDDDEPTLNGEVVRANEKQSDFLQSQSRAMTTLSRMIKDYEELCKTNMATEQQKQRIEQIKANTEFTKEKTKLIKGTKKDTSILEALIDLENEEDE